ncbi:MAG: c-type cytochrome [Thermodesulfobacteriota bacterium]
MRIPKLLQFFIIVAVIYGFFKAPGVLLGKPIPSSLIIMYMFFAVVTVLLVMTSTDESTAELFAPVRALVEDPSKRMIRNAVFAVVPLAAGLLTYSFIRPGFTPPAMLRSVHPAPPARIKAYGRSFELNTLKNPLRGLEREDPEKFRTLVGQGGEIYFRNCFFCHGDKLDGKGHYARAVFPAPLPFTGKDTIAQLSESYVFWRVVKGGPGLPAEAAPQLSMMPAWEGTLSEEEVWKVILFIYDYTGNRPRAWKERRRGRR